MSVSLIVGAALPVSAETLADALIAAYRNSNLLAQNQAVLRAADENVAEAVASLRPVVAFVADGQYGYSEELLDSGITVSAEDLFANYSVTAQMTLFDFGRTQLAIEAAKETVLATREALISIEQQVLLSAVSAFVNVRLQQEIVSLRENNVRVIGEQLRAAQDRFEVGEVTRTDVAQAEARLAQARANLVVAQGDLAIARENYRAATGSYPGALSAPPAPPRTADTLDAARSVALRTHPSIRQAQREVKAAELNVARARANLKPSIAAQAQLSVDQDGLQENGFGRTGMQVLPGLNSAASRWPRMSARSGAILTSPMPASPPPNSRLRPPRSPLTVCAKRQALAHAPPLMCWMPNRICSMPVLRACRRWRSATSASISFCRRWAC